MIAFVYGTTAELIKIAPVYRQLVDAGTTPLLWCTGQQYEELPGAPARLGLPEPDRWLARGVRGRSLSRPVDVPRWLATFLRSVLRQRTDLRHDLRADGLPPVVLVHGDTMTTVLGAVLGRWLGAAVGHIEAGLRSGNPFQPFPEELDRRVTSVLAGIHFAPGADAVANLGRTRGVTVDTVHNTVLDSLRMVPAEVQPDFGPLPPRYGLVSLHRFELVRNGARLAGVFEALARHSTEVPLFAVTDPVVSAALSQHGLEGLFSDRFVRLPKLPYLDFVALLRGASFVVTDSGGLQEECAYLDVPCLVHRSTTERNDGVGRNVVLSGFDLQVLESFLADPDRFRSGAAVEARSPSRVIVEHLREHGYLGPSSRATVSNSDGGPALTGAASESDSPAPVEGMGE